MKPTGDRIIIRPLPQDSKTESGLIIPEAAKGKPTRGEVLYIGDDPIIGCNVGDFILFPEQAGTDFNYMNLDVKVIRWNDVQVILDRDVKSAAEIIKEEGVLIVYYQQLVNSGTIKEKLCLDINGFVFFLQGNTLIPIATLNDMVDTGSAQIASPVVQEALTSAMPKL